MFYKTMAIVALIAVLAFGLSMPALAQDTKIDQPEKTNPILEWFDTVFDRDETTLFADSTFPFLVPFESIVTGYQETKSFDAVGSEPRTTTSTTFVEDWHAFINGWASPAPERHNADQSFNWVERIEAELNRLVKQFQSGKDISQLNRTSPWAFADFALVE